MSYQDKKGFMEKETDFRPFKMKKRTLTRFLCEEMLYDFATDNLDPERRRAVSEFLKESKECQDELESLYGGIEFAEKLSRTKISEPLFKKIRDAKSPLNEWLGKYRWTTWPESIKWTVEAVGISMAVVVVFALVSPKVMEYWPATANQQLVLVEVDKKPKLPGTGEASPDIKAANEKLPPTPEQKTVKEALTTTPAPAVVAEAPKPVEAVKPAATQAATPKPRETAKAPEVVAAAPTPAAPSSKPATPAQAPAVVAKSSSSQTDEDISEAKTPAKSHDKAMRGFLYRAFMELENLDVVTEKITAEITTLGGEKAGEVPLGWRKPKGSYYHFTMPEANYDQLITNLKNYGEVRLYKDPHPRVMPEGVIRLILSVEDARLKK